MNKATREEYKTLPEGDYHLCLDRLEGRWIFQTDEDYRMGMAGMAISVLKFGVIVYAFELMPNHSHTILHGTGEQCLKFFSFQKRRISEMLIRNSRPPLPQDYGCKLIPIPDDESLRAQILYCVRNPYEKDYCGPGGHKWGSGYLYYNELASVIRGKPVSSFSKAALRSLIRSDEQLPPDWEIHPVLGVLPRNYVQFGTVERLFGSAKEYHTCLVKEYETAVKIARTLDEHVEFSQKEIKEIANTELRNSYPGRLFKTITQEEKCRVAVRLHESLGLSSLQLSQALYLSELTITQALRSKDYGLK